ncbi:PQQ-dependent sugar dehydrogenase [soil metagenome]
MASTSNELMQPFPVTWFVRLPLLAVIVTCVGCAPRSEGARDWRTEWAVEDGFALNIDTQGYEYPSAIAFVPQPGPAPSDPLYFVAELRGRVKVVTNDRQVHTFAEGFIVSRPRKELPDIEGETGLAGLCLDPERGLVFVTYAYTDSAGVLRNGISRFQSIPGTFSLRPASHTVLPGVFDGYEIVPSHQVGGCYVDGDLLHMGVGDARQTARSQDTSSVLGKVLRMTVDGLPAPGNPFYRDADPTKASNLIWSYGHRNPFGIRVIDGRIIVADNGSGVDRILEARGGSNYLYDGSDEAMGTNAVTVLVPSIGPAQIEYVAAGGSVLPPRFGGTLLIALSSTKSPGVLAMGYDPDVGSAATAPRPFVRYLGGSLQVVVGVAAGPDGVYFLPLMPDETGRSSVLRVRYDPARAHPLRIATTHSASDLMISKGCVGCHSIRGEGGVVGPPLDRDEMVQRIRQRLDSDAYARAAAALDTSQEEPFRSFRNARADVLRLRGEERVATWIRYRLLEPRFDDPHAQMPNVGLTDAEARLITQHLVQRPGRLQRLKAAVKSRLPAKPRPRHLVAFGAAGVFLGASASLLGWFVFVRLRERAMARRRNHTHVLTDV